MLLPSAARRNVSTHPTASINQTTSTRRAASLFLRPVVYASLALSLCLSLINTHVHARKRRAPATGRAAVVVDERLSALRDAPDSSANLIQRLGRGRAVSIAGSKRTADGLTFHRVAVTSRTVGWVQGEALVSPSRAEDAERLLRLIRGSEEFDRLERARIFLETFPRSPLRPAVLLLYAEAAEEAATRLTRDALRRLDPREMEAGGAPLFSYFQNYNGLDRYNRLGLRFHFDRTAKKFRYDGAAWRELLKRHPQSPEATHARARLDALHAP